MNSSLGKMLLEEISPVVMVLCTPLVEETFLKNGISFVETLKPFCNFSNIDGDYSLCFYYSFSTANFTKLLIRGLYMLCSSC